MANNVATNGSEVVQVIFSFCKASLPGHPSVVPRYRCQAALLNPSLLLTFHFQDHSFHERNRFVSMIIIREYHQPPLSLVPRGPLPRFGWRASPSSSSDGIGSASSGRLERAALEDRVAFSASGGNGVLGRSDDLGRAAIGPDGQALALLVGEYEADDLILGIELDGGDAAGRSGDDIGFGDGEDEHAGHSRGQADVLRAVGRLDAHDQVALEQPGSSRTTCRPLRVDRAARGASANRSTFPPAVKAIA